VVLAQDPPAGVVGALVQVPGPGEVTQHPQVLSRSLGGYRGNAKHQPAASCACSR
jgi:hypothetical protein